MNGFGGQQRGAAGVLAVLVYSAIILVIGTTMVATSVISHQVSNKRIASTQTAYHAESGAEDALLQIKRDSSYGSTTESLTTTFDAFNRVETIVETVSGEGPCANPKRVTASGFVKQQVRRVRLTNCPSPSPNVDFVYALQAGAGGIDMSNNSTIFGTTYSNGNHTAGPGARVTGDAWVAGGAAPTATPQHDPGSVVDYPFGNVASKVDAAQSFIADTSSSDKLIKVALKVRRFGNPSNATVRIVTDNADKPSGTQIASGTLQASTVGLTYTFVDISLTTPPTLSNGTKYWIVVDAAQNAANYWGWGDQAGYGPGKNMYSDRWRSSGAMTWTNINSDFAFKAFMGSPPTSISGLTVNNDAHANTLNNNAIGRNAYFQANNGSTIAGTAYPGSADPPTRDLPITEAVITDFKNLAAAGTVHTGDYVVPLNSTRVVGPIKITGNLVVENNATLVMTGTIWVQGNVTFSNNATLRLDAGYGPDSGALVTDGTATLSNNMTALGSGNPDSFIMLVSTSASATAIDVSNNASSIILATINGTIHINNNGGANALAAYRLTLANNATVTYLSGLADVQFSAGPGGSFQAGGWKEIIQD